MMAVSFDDGEVERSIQDDASSMNPPRSLSFEQFAPSKNVNQRGSHHSADHVHRRNKLSACLHRCFEAVSDYIRRLFTLPLNQHPPMAFIHPEDYDTKGKKIDNPDEEEYQRKMDLIEAAANYTSRTKDILEEIIYNRKIVGAKTNLAHDVDWTKLAPWNKSFLGHLESIFLVLDCSGDGLVDYDEIVTMLTDYGDTTPDQERRAVFSSVDTQGKGAISFAQFVEMFHSVTVKAPENYPPTLVDSFRSLDRNMARVRGLDVVQQLQTGLF